MTRFVEFHSTEKRNESFIINIEEISVIRNESNENYSITYIKLRDGSLFRVAETKEEIIYMMNHIR